MKFICIALSILLSIVQLHAEDAANDFVRSQAAAEALDKERLKVHAGDADKLVLPGVLADRKTRRVELSGVFNDLDEHASVEFLVIGKESANDYEALVRAYVTPSDVRKALTFIGMSPGRPFDPDAFRFWPRGERVRVELEWTGTDGAGEAIGIQEPAGNLVYNSKAKKVIPSTGYTFSGSRQVKDKKTGEQVWTADAFGPFCVISLFNHPDTVLDVPYTSHQNEVYANYQPNKKIRPKGGTPVKVVLTPEYPEGKLRVTDVSVSVLPSKRADGRDIRDLRYMVGVGDEKPVEKTLEGFLGVLAALNAEGRDAFASFDPNPELTVANVRDLYGLVNELAAAGRLRVEPPSEGALFFRAYTPPEHFRKREDRISQPIELRLKKNGDRVDGRLVFIEQKWPKGQVKPTLIPTEVPVADATELVARLKETKWDVPVILAFVPGDLTRGAFLEFVKGARAIYPTLHVFVEKP